LAQKIGGIAPECSPRDYGLWRTNCSWKNFQWSGNPVPM